MIRLRILWPEIRESILQDIAFRLAHRFRAHSASH